MAARQKIREEESDDDERQQAGLRTTAAAVRTTAAAVRKTHTYASKHRDAFAEKEIKIEPIYPNIADSPGQISISQLNRHERAVMQARALLLAQETEVRKSARRFAPMPELDGTVVYSKKERMLDVHPAQIDVRPAPMAVAEAPSAFLKDGLMSEEELHRQLTLAEVNAPVLLPPMQAVSQGRKRTARIAAAARLRQWLMQWVRRVSALLSQMRGPMLTRTGRQAMAQLQRLYALVAAGVSDDGMEMVQLRVAFGEAYYHMMEASRRHHRRHKGREHEDYGAYFNQFLRAAPE